jgi:hypothetical protein
MVAIDKSPAGPKSHAADYFRGGYQSIEAFLAENAQAAIKLFEPGHPADPRTLAKPRDQAERRHGKRGLLTWLLQSIGGQPFDYFEFGVMSCRTFNRVIEGTANRDARFYGFDTFEGLPEPWVKEMPTGALRLGRAAGDLKAEHAPAVYDPRATLFKGLFQDTLPEALERAFPDGRRTDRPLFVNIDSDLYSSALYALTSMHTLLRSGDYVYFDEFFDALNEFAAFNDYIRAYNAKGWFSPVARSYDGLLFRVSLPAPNEVARVIDRRTTGYLGRMKAYARARVFMLKGRASANSP